MPTFLQVILSINYPVLSLSEELCPDLPSAGHALGRPASLSAEFAAVGDPAQGLRCHWKSRQRALSAAKWCSCSLFLFSWSQQGSLDGWERGRGSFWCQSSPTYLHPVCSALPMSPEKQKKRDCDWQLGESTAGAVSPSWSTHGEEGSSFSSLWIVLGLFSRAFSRDSREKARGDFCFLIFF